MMDTELDNHMGYEKHDQKGDKNNYRNGHTNKTLKTSYAKTDIKVPRDRNSSFEPIIIEKHQRDISYIDSKIINLYAGYQSPVEYRLNV